MKNPLNKRFKRELLQDFGKYAVIFILLTSVIGLVSGFLVADDSMLIAYDNSFEEYNIEDGHVIFTKELNKSQTNDIQDLGITLYKNYYYENSFDNDTTIRLFAMRSDVNKVCLMDGEFPKDNEIAIDRMYADNNNLSIGDTLKDNNHTYKISGLVALSDYSALFSDNNDMMFDAIKFGVAIITQNDFDSYSINPVYEYSYKWLRTIEDEIELHEANQQLVEDINSIVPVKDFLAQADNQAITFTGEDMGGDKAMWVVILYIMIGIISFVFSITIRNTIVKESNVIGTLRATGFTKDELVHHYMTLPIIVTIISAVIGNVIGYTVMKDYMADLYYGSYSLPTYKTIFNSEAFILTTLVPVIIMLVITFVELRKSLSFSPLQFIRRDLSKNKKHKSLKLSHKLPIMSRFRTRVIVQNMNSYVVILIGIIFSNLLLFFGLALPDVLNNYSETITNNMLCNYQTILSVPNDVLYNSSKLETTIKYMNFMNEVETKNTNAEKFSVYSLKNDNSVNDESIMIYGICDDSKYINIDHSKIYISSAFAGKYKVKVGDTIILKEQYENKKYSFHVDEIYDYDSSIAVFMDQKAMNKTFGYDDNFFCGYFSETPIDDISQDYIGSVIDLESMTKLSRQLKVSMGSMMDVVNVFAMLIFMVITYLLSKTIIEKNANNISMIKILGYNSKEISMLYVLATGIMTVLFIILSVPIVTKIIEIVWEFYLTQMFSGYLNMVVSSSVYIKMVLYGIACYIVLSIIQYMKIAKINLAEALKNEE